MAGQGVSETSLKDDGGKFSKKLSALVLVLNQDHYTFVR